MLNILVFFLIWYLIFGFNVWYVKPMLWLKNSKDLNKGFIEKLKHFFNNKKNVIEKKTKKAKVERVIISLMMAVYTQLLIFYLN